MKSLLRSSILAIVAFAAYSGITAHGSGFSVPGTQRPTCVPGAFCAVNDNLSSVPGTQRPTCVPGAFCAK
jgi:hypothetical protein